MTGLILKDFLILRKTLRSYLFMLVVYVGIAFTGVWSADIVGVLMVVMVVMLPMNVFAYDKQAKWDTYGLALPVGRTKTVAARYVCVLLLCLLSVGLTAILGMMLYAAGRVEEPVEFLVSCSVTGLMAVLSAGLSRELSAENASPDSPGAPSVSSSLPSTFPVKVAAVKNAVRTITSTSAPACLLGSPTMT